MIIQGADIKFEADKLSKEIKSLDRKIKGRQKSINNFSGLTLDHKESELTELKNIRSQKQKYLEKINKDVSKFWS